MEARRQLIRRARTGFARPASEKPSSALRPLRVQRRRHPCSIPGRRSSPLAAHCSAPSLLVPVGGAFGFFLVVLARLLNFSPSTLSLPLPPSSRIIDKFDIAARYTSPFIPSCLDLVVRLSLSYRHRQPQHSLRDNPKTKPHPLIPYSVTRPRPSYQHSLSSRRERHLFSVPIHF